MVGKFTTHCHNTKNRLYRFLWSRSYTPYSLPSRLLTPYHRFIGADLNTRIYFPFVKIYKGYDAIWNMLQTDYAPLQCIQSISNDYPCGGTLKLFVFKITASEKFKLLIIAGDNCTKMQQYECIIMILGSRCAFTVETGTIDNLLTLHIFAIVI